VVFSPGASADCESAFASRWSAQFAVKHRPHRPREHPQKTPPVLGTIKSIAGESLTVTTDAGTETKVAVTPATKLLRVPPGSKDLSQAEAIPFSEFQQGDPRAGAAALCRRPIACDVALLHGDHGPLRKRMGRRHSAAAPARDSPC